MPNFSANIGNSYGLTSSPSASASVLGSGGVRTRTLRFLGEAFGGVNGSSAFGNIQPRSEEFTNGDTAGYEFGLTVQIQFTGQITGVNFFKSQTNTGPHSVSVWKTDGTKMNTTVCDVAYDVDGVAGWVYQTLSSPVAVTAGDTFIVSYTCPAGHYSIGDTFLINDQHWPFIVPPTTPAYYSTTTGSFPNVSSGAWFMLGLDFSYTTTEPALNYANYMSRFTNGPPPSEVQISVFAADTQFDGYKAAGFTNIRLFDYIEDSPGAVSTGIKATALGNANSPSVQQAVASNPAMANTVEMYTLDDEIDIVLGTAGNVVPATAQQYVAKYRTYDSTRPISLNLGKFSVAANYTYSVNTLPWKANWDYYSNVDVVAADAYCLTDTTLGPVATGGGPPGIWGYSRAAQKLADYCHGSKPVAFFIETVNSDNVPSPSNLYKAVWSGIIGGGRMLNWFDHNFGSSKVDNYIYSNPTQYNAVKNINNLVQSLAEPILNPGQDGVVTSVTSSNNTQAISWGITGVPIQYTVRKDNSGNFYIFSQPYRLGNTNSTWTVPCAANATITVVNESRTLTADSSGVFSDSYTQDYQVHIYKWTPTSSPSATATDDVFPKIFYPPPPPAAGGGSGGGGPDLSESFFGSTVPTTPDGGDGATITLALKVTPNVDGQITKVRYYKVLANNDSQAHQGMVWANGGTTPLITETITSTSSTGWQEHIFTTPIDVTADQTYWVGVFMGSGHYSYDPVTYPFNMTSGDVTALGTSYSYKSTVQTDSMQFLDIGAHNAYVDLGFVAS
jgi:hypothetical protein